MADSKLRDLTAVGTPALTDLLYLLADPSGTPLDRKMTLSQLRALISGEDLLQSVTVSNAAQIDAAAWYSSDYDDYVMELLDIVPASDAAELQMLVSTDGGSTYDTGNNYYWTHLRFHDSASGLDGSPATSKIALATSITNTANYVAAATMHLKNPGSSAFKNIYGTVTARVSSGDSHLLTFNTSAFYLSTTAYDGIRIKCHNGNITGTLRIYGKKK